jgi:hypothetical protein
MLSKDVKYTYAKEAYSQMSAFDLDEAGLPHVFDLLTTQQKEFFVTFFEFAQNDFRDEHDIATHDKFFSELVHELGYKGSDVVEDILDRYNLKICK